MKKLLSLIIAILISVIAVFPEIKLTVIAEQDSESAVQIHEFTNPNYSEETNGRPAAADIQGISDIITDEDIAYVRSQLVSRNREFMLQYPYDSELYDSDSSGYALHSAMAHTGLPKEGDYLSFQYDSASCSTSTEDNITTLDFTLDYYTDAVQENTVDQAVEKLLQELDVYNATDYVKILTVYNWIVKNVSYDYKTYEASNKLKYTAYAALVKRKAVCQGYACLFYRLMLELGVDCRIVNGIAGSGLHAWNIVRLNGKYYYIDTTWGSTSGYTEEFFLKGSSSSSFSSHHASDQFNTPEFTSVYPIDPKDYRVKDNDIHKGFLFKDVRDPLAYYFKAVYWAYDHEPQITKGYDDRTFRPKNNCTRQELAIFLWRLEGKPEVSGTLPFSDTNYAESSDSFKAILWCSQQEIVRGYSDGTFRPKADVSRKDTMIMLYRLAGKPDVSGKIEFPDVIKMNLDRNSDTYKAILWGVNNGITNGYKDGSFKPKAKCLREHIVTFIYRYDLRAAADIY